MTQEIDFSNRIKHLTSDEVQTLQADAALRALGENNNILSELNSALIDAMKRKLKADMEVLSLKETKRSLVQNLKSLAVICARA